MIQEKDFLYRVPVKTAPITTPGGQIRNPEILVDVEGGEFMHGNILDANSTNKLINQSVKDAVDNKLIESGYVTQDLLDAETTRATEQENSLKTLIGAETSARTKGDEDLSAKIKAEQTRAEGKEKEISDKLAIVNGDSNTEGSFRKAIADVVAAAPEDLDTLKEIADKLAGNDDLHTALNQAITEKADASALANEVTRATGAESGLQAAIATKADATALSNYVLTTALNKQVDTLNTAISAKQDAGNYIPYDNSSDTFYTLEKGLTFGDEMMGINIDAQCVMINQKNVNIGISRSGLEIHRGDYSSYLSGNSIILSQDLIDNSIVIDPGEISSNRNEVNQFKISSTGIILGDEVSPTVRISSEGIKFAGQTARSIPTAGGTFVELSSLASAEDISNLKVGLSKKQDKITVNEVDITDIETADITKLRTIVTNLINALSASNLIRATQGLE